MADLTVCIPHCGEPYLAEAIASVEAQQLDLELVVVEDTAGAGGGVTRNRCLEQVRTEWVFMLDADNVLPPGTLVALLREKRKGTIVTTQEIQFFDATEDLHRWHFYGPDIVPYAILTRSQTPASTGNVLFHRLAFDRGGELRGYPEDCGAYDTWAFFACLTVDNYWWQCAYQTSYHHRIRSDSYWNRRAPHRRQDLANALLHVYGDRFDV